jgi:CPA2 family monovalent cation:H+ antiporter-2
MDAHGLLAVAATEGPFWGVMGQLVVLLGAAFALGTLFEKLHQSAIIGYLIAGTVLGSNVLGLMGAEGEAAVGAVAELGVAMLLFTIGLEFSIKQLLRVGPIGLGGGTVQVVGTLGAGAGIGVMLGMPMSSAVVLGAVAALSSTATVVRLLGERAQLDSVHGRASLGILLLQDLAVVPLVLVVGALGGEGTVEGVLLELGNAAALIVAMVAVFGLGSWLVRRRVLRERALVRNRELLTLLAVVMGLGAAVAAGKLNLSPALGAFVAGLMLAESPFALQIRADIAALRTLFVTLFFVSVGMLGDPVWMVDHIGLVLGATAAVVLGKAAIVTGVALGFGYHLRHGVAMGLSLGQVGEFSFVLAAGAAATGAVDEQMFKLIVSVTLLTLLLTPYLVIAGPGIGNRLERVVRPREVVRDEASRRVVMRDHVIVVGFGPSGQEVVETLRRRGVMPVVVDLHSRNVAQAQRAGVVAVVGDAGSGEVWEHVHVEQARAVVITIPDHATALGAVHQVKLLAPHVPTIVRARYHTFVPDLAAAGAEAVVDEEHLMGRRLAAVVSQVIGPAEADQPDPAEG